MQIIIQILCISIGCVIGCIIGHILWVYVIEKILNKIFL